MTNEWKLRDEICQVGRRLYDSGDLQWRWVSLLASGDAGKVKEWVMPYCISQVLQA